MADELDAMLQGDDSSSVPPAGTTGQQDDSIRKIEQQTEEEVEFNGLSGSARERFEEMYKRAKEAENKLGQQQQTYVPPAPNTLAPDQKQALETLSQYGVATDEKVDKKLSEEFNRLRWDMENQRLESTYSGKNGEPQYKKEEVEDYIRNHPQYSGYAAEDVFKFKMFPDEFSNMQQKGSSSQRSSSLRPTRSQVMSEDVITAENVEEMVKSHSQEWYNENQEAINKAVAAHTQQFKGVNFGQ